MVRLSTEPEKLSAECGVHFSNQDSRIEKLEMAYINIKASLATNAEQHEELNRKIDLLSEDLKPLKEIAMFAGTGRRFVKGIVTSLILIGILVSTIYSVLSAIGGRVV